MLDPLKNGGLLTIDGKIPTPYLRTEWRQESGLDQKRYCAMREMSKVGHYTTALRMPRLISRKDRHQKREGTRICPLRFAAVWKLRDINHATDVHSRS